MNFARFCQSKIQLLLQVCRCSVRRLELLLIAYMQLLHGLLRGKRISELF